MSGIARAGLRAGTPVAAPGRSMVVRGLVVLATFLAGTLLVLLRDVLLPSRFSNDAASIQAIGQGTRTVVDPAYESVAEAYRLLGLIDSSLAAGLVGYALAFAVLTVSARRLLRPSAPITAVVLFFAAVMLSAVFLGTYSKDVFVLPIVLIAVLPGGRWRWPVLTALAIVAYALVFRTYWFLVLAVWLGLQLLLARRPRPILLLVAMLAAALALAVAVTVALHQPADIFRTQSNEGRGGADDAASAILPFLGGGTDLAGLVNTPLTLLTLLVPLPLLLKGGAYFLVLSTAITAFWTRTWIALDRARRAPQPPAERSRIALLLAFVVVQALFEPDYGSALRHLTPLLPIAVLLWSRPAAARPTAAAAWNDATA